MDKIELMGLLLQDLRNDKERGEEGLDLAQCRETSKIFDLLIQHGELSRSMFDTTAFDYLFIAEEYSEYKITYYPEAYVMFAGDFTEWLLGAGEDTLSLMQLVLMIKRYSSLRIKIVRKKNGWLVIVRSPKHSNVKFKESAVFEK